MEADAWTQVEVEDPDGLSGFSIVRLIRVLTTVLPVRVVAVREVEGSGERITQLFPPDAVSYLDVEEFLRRASGIKQFDWGDFFLLESIEACSRLENVSYIDDLPRALATVRAVDSGYFFVYTTSASAVSALMREHPTAKSKTGKIEDLTFPY